MLKLLLHKRMRLLKEPERTLKRRRRRGLDKTYRET